MKKYGILIVFFLNFYVFAPASVKHPFYVDVEIFNYNVSTQTFEITLRVFMDDAQTIVDKNQVKADFYNVKDTPIVREFYYPYIQKNLRILCNGKLLSFDWVGYEREQGIILFYLESMPIANPKDIQIQSTLLCGYFDQSHIVEIHVNKSIRNSKLDCRNTIFKTQF